MQKPETVSWAGPEWLLHQAALNRGHGEALTDVAANLARAARGIQDQIAQMPEGATAEQWQAIALQFPSLLETMGVQFGQQATKSRADGQGLLAQACAGRIAVNAVAEPETPSRPVLGLFAR